MKGKHSLRSSGGFTLIDVMIATAIMFTGATVMIVNLPLLLAQATTRVSADNAYVYASAKYDEICATTAYSDINTSGTTSGNFNTLLPGSSEAGLYSWSYTAAEIQPDLLKSIEMTISWGSGSSQKFKFYIADVNDD